MYCFFFFRAGLGLFLSVGFPIWKVEEGQQKGMFVLPTSLLLHPASCVLLSSLCRCNNCNTRFSGYFHIFLSRVYALSGGSGHRKFYLRTYWGMRGQHKEGQKTKGKNVTRFVFFSEYFAFSKTFFRHLLLRRLRKEKQTCFRLGLVANTDLKTQRTKLWLTL